LDYDYDKSRVRETKLFTSAAIELEIARLFHLYSRFVSGILPTQNENKGLIHMYVLVCVTHLK